MLGGLIRRGGPSFVAVLLVGRGVGWQARRVGERIDVGRVVACPCQPRVAGRHARGLQLVAVTADVLRQPPRGDLGTQRLVASLDDPPLTLVLLMLQLRALLSVPLGAHGRGAALDLRQYLG